MAEPQRWDSEAEKTDLPTHKGYEWRIQSALLTEEVTDLGTMRVMMLKAMLPGSVDFSDDEAEAFTHAFHHKMIDTLIEMGKL